MRYVVAALAVAAAAFLAATLLVREHPQVRAALGGDLAQRFPAQAKSFGREARFDAARRAKRGHAFSIRDEDEGAPDTDPRWERILAGRPKRRPVPGACLSCHASAASAQAAEYYGARERKPLGCEDCHDGRTAALRLTRTAPREPAGFQDLRTLVCAQCHRAYSLLSEGGALRFTGPSEAQVTAFFESRANSGWVHAETGARVAEPRHPQFEMHAQGIHARAGVGCPDCHMPAARSGAVLITDHRTGSPLDMPGPACGPCHRQPPEMMRARVREIQERTAALSSRARDALVAAIDAIQRAQAPGARAGTALELQTKAQWRLTFVAADRSKGFHAPQWSARLLGEAIDYARQAQLAAVKVGVNRQPGVR